MKPGDHPLVGLPALADGVPRVMAKSQAVLTGVGVAILFMLCVMPMWSAVELMQDISFVFFNGQFVPGLMLGLCVSIITSYFVVMCNFFSRAPFEEQNYRGVMSIAHMFIGLLGLMLVLVSFPLSIQASKTAADLSERRLSQELFQRLYEYSQVLHNIRALPACAMKMSVEECEGYADAPPYTSFLKAMEKDFECSGFCYKPLPSSQKVVNGKATQSFTPPTLFSRADYEVPCEGMLSRDMQNFAGDVSTQVFYEGLCLVIVAGTVACIKLAGLRSLKARY